MLRLVVKGRVQGVGFRYFTRTLAEEMGIDGAVWNTRQGNVEATICHQNDLVLEDFIDRLKSGPGYVSEIASAPEIENEVEPGFEIWPTR